MTQYNCIMAIAVVENRQTKRPQSLDGSISDAAEKPWMELIFCRKPFMPPKAFNQYQRFHAAPAISQTLAQDKRQIASAIIQPISIERAGVKPADAPEDK
jgi:hypothetical protein